MKRKFLLLFLMCLLGGLGSLMAQTTVTIDGTVGDYAKNTSKYVPFHTNYKYTTSQQIYLADELGMKNGNTITNVAFSVKSTSTSITRTIKIYMVNTELERLPLTATNKFIQMSSSDLVYDGNITIDANNKWYDLKLSGDGFTYTGNNILLCVYDYTGVDTGKDIVFNTYNSRVQDSDGNNIIRGVYKYASTAYDPTIADNCKINMTAGGNYMPQIQFTYKSGGSSAPTAPADPIFTDTYAYPNGQYATSIFNPSLSFYAEYKTHYKVLLSTTEDFSSDVRYVAGSETEWVNDETKQIYTSTVEGLNYAKATTYYWKVIAKNVNAKDNLESNTVESTVYSFTTKQISAPGAIENAYPNGHQDLIDPKFTWTFGTDTEEYQVLIDGVAVTEWTNPGSSTTGEYQTSGLSSGNHTWRIDARNSVDTTTGTEYTFSVASLPDNVTPISPTNGATGVTSKTIKFRFAEGTEEYRILYSDTNPNEMSYVSTKYGGTGSAWTSTNGATEIEFEMPSLSMGKTYYWAVDVQNSIGKRSVWNGGEDVTIYSFTAASTLPVTYAYPANGAIASEVNPALSWNYVGNAGYYQVWFGTKNNLQIVKDWTARGENDQYQTSNLKAASEYYWQVNVRETETSEILYGDIVSFITKLEVPQNVSANPEKVEPSLSEYGSTQIMWNSIKGAIGYNVYLDGVKLNSTTTNSYTVKAEDRKIKSNMDPGYNFTVTAVYEGYGESGVSEAVNVKVANVGMLIVYIKDPNNNPIEGASIELSGISEFGKEKTYTILSDATGKGSKSILVADYAMTISKDNYSSYSNESVKIEKGSEKILNVTLASEYIYNVTAEETETNGNIKITLTGKEEGYYNVYLKTNESEELIKENAWFSGFGSAQYVYESWNTLNNGTYQFGVANYNSNIINWSNEITRDYAIFNTNGDWNTASNWKEGLPQSDDNVLIYANATIAATDVITVGTVDIKAGSLTINGSLTADKVYNKNESALVIKDGGQLFQKNAELKGQFVMNIRNDWSASNKGWQFISSPFVDATTASFESTDGDFDLYKYDGSKENEWVNYKNTGDDSGEEPETPGEEPGEEPELPEVGGKSEFSFNFDDGSLEGWEIIDKDGDGYGWYLTYENGSLVLISESWVNKKLVPDDYIVTTEKYTITESSLLSFSHIQYDTYAYNEHIGVVISEDGENYTTIWDYDYDGENFLTEWKTEVVDLSEYAGKNLYLGIRYYDCNGDEATGILVDNITLTTGSKTRNSNTRSFDEETFAQGVGYLASYETQATATLVGTFNTKTSFDYKVSYTADKELANFHLLGNPFPFNMDMRKATYTSLVECVAYVNENGGYTYVGKGQEEIIIPAGDGFFVKAKGYSPKLSYDHNAEIEDERSRQANSINVIATGKAGKDNVVINFAGQSEGFNKLQNFNEDIATVFVVENGKRYGFANVDENATEVELSFVASQMGSYSISLDVNGEFETVTLVDRFTGIETNMLLEDEYNFTATSNDSHNRFVVRLVNRQQTTDNGQFVYQSGEELILSIEGSVQIVDMLGRVVYSNEHASGNNRIYVGEFNNATYVVRVVNEEGVKVQKVVIY